MVLEKIKRVPNPGCSSKEQQQQTLCAQSTAQPMLALAKFQGDMWQATGAVVDLCTPLRPCLGSDAHSLWRNSAQNMAGSFKPIKKRKSCFISVPVLVALKSPGKASSTNIKLTEHTNPPIKRRRRNSGCNIYNVCRIPEWIIFHPTISDFALSCRCYG